MRRYEPKPWDIRRCDMVHADDGEYVRYDDAHAKIERLTKERDEARAQVAAAFEAAGSVAAERCAACGVSNTGALVREYIRRLTPAHAQAALEAYGREKVREAMQRAVELYPQGIAAIIAEMEKEASQ